MRAIHALPSRRSLVVATRTSVLEIARVSSDGLLSETRHIGTFEEALTGGIVDGGMAWSADDERVMFLLEPPARFLLMSSDFTPLHEVQLGTADAQPDAALATVGAPICPLFVRRFSNSGSTKYVSTCIVKVGERVRRSLRALARSRRRAVRVPRRWSLLPSRSLLEPVPVLHVPSRNAVVARASRLPPRVRR